MTRAPDDAPELWAKQVSPKDPHGPATWSTRLLPGHLTVQHSYRRPAAADLGPQDRVID